MKNTGFYPRMHVDTANIPAVGHAGGVLLTETIRATGLGNALSEALSPWRKPFAVHDPAKVVLDLAVTLALGGDTLSDIHSLRAEPSVFGKVASDPTVSRTITALADDADRVLTAIKSARAHARTIAWNAAGPYAPNAAASPETPVVIDLDATLVTAHSDKEHAAPTYKRGYGFHPLLAFVDHGADGTGEMIAAQLRPGNAGSNTAADHISVTRAALAGLPGGNPRPGKSVLVRADGAGGTKQFIEWLTKRRLTYSVGFTLPFEAPELYRMIPEDCWTAALDADGEPREGADVAEFTGVLNLEKWPAGMRVIVRRECPHPGAQLRFEDVDGYRLTAFATNTKAGQHATLELRHRRRARCEDRIRNAKDTGLRNLPLYGFDQNRIWCEIVALATEIIAWAQLLGYPTHEARRWEAKRLRYRLFTIPATIAHHSRQVVLHLSNRNRWGGVAHAAIMRLRLLPEPSS